MHVKYICTEHALIYLKSRLFFNLAKLKNAGETQDSSSYSLLHLFSFYFLSQQTSQENIANKTVMTVKLPTGGHLTLM